MDGESQRVFFEKGGLQLIGRCDLGGLDVYARSTVADGMLHANDQGAGTNDYYEYDDLDAGVMVNLSSTMFSLGTDDNAGQLVFGRPGGTTLSIDWLAEYGEGYNGERDCIFQGTARRVDSSSPDRANYRVNTDDGPTTFFNRGGLKLIGQCTGFTLDVTAKTSTDHAVIHANSQYINDGFDAASDNDFNTGETLNLEDAANGLMDNTVGQIVYAKPGGKTVTVEWAAEDDAEALDRDCVFNGVARVRESGDAKRVNFRVPQGGTAGATTFFSQGGLKLKGECTAGVPHLNVLVSTTSGNTTIHYNGQYGSVAKFDENDSFDSDPGDRFSLIGELVLFVEDEDASGQIVYSSFGGTNVTVHWAELGDPGGSYRCAFVGTAEVGT